MRSNARLASMGWLCLVLLAASQVLAQEKQQAPVAPYTMRVTAVLVDKADAPLKGKRIWAYPLNAKGEALIVRTTPPGYVYKIWNPVTETDSTGKFVLEMPLVTRIDGSAIAEVVIGVGNPAGGLSLRSEKGIEYADPKREREDCLTMEVAVKELSLLRKGAEILKVKIGEKSRETDLGKIVVE